MDISEAYNILGVDKSISDEDLKSRYKKLAKDHHPDLHPDQAETFKQINAAHQLIQEYREHPEKFQPRSPFGGGNPFSGFGVNIQDIFNNLNNEPQQKQINLPPIVFNIEITFQESILGVSKELKYTRCIKCDTCNGVGSEMISNGCKNCDGFGRITRRSGNTVFTSSCNKCQGRGTTKKNCATCIGRAVKDMDIAGSVNIPPGTKNTDVLRLQGAGHYTGNSIFGDAYGHVSVNIKVLPEDNMLLVGTDVVSTLKLSMADALIGCKREVNTVLGLKEIEIVPMSRNNEEVEIKGCGVANTNGTHRVVLDVEYPENTQELIEFLLSERSIKCL
jgi:molecular chaperone DnaJ